MTKETARIEELERKVSEIERYALAAYIDSKATLFMVQKILAVSYPPFMVDMMLKQLILEVAEEFPESAGVIEQIRAEIVQETGLRH